MHRSSERSLVHRHLVLSRLIVGIPVAALLLTACDRNDPVLPAGVGDQTRYDNRTFLIGQIVDGDTAVLPDGTSVRYIGIDAPEERPVEQCGAREATAANEALVLGRPTTLLLDPAETRDRFGRLLAYLQAEDGTNINVELTRQGVVCAFPFGDTRRFREPIASAESEAREARRGVWGTCPPISDGCPDGRDP